MNTIDKAIELKESGLTTQEVIDQLIKEGRTMPNGDPITKARIYKWVKGINPQGGRRKQCMKNMSQAEREEYLKGAKERSKAYQREWRLKNKEYLSSWNKRWYEENRLTLRRKLNA